MAWASSFANLNIAGLAWIAPGLLLFATLGAGGSLGFRVGYVAGAVHYLISLSWLRFIPFPAGAFAGWFALSLFLALFPALWCVACARVARAMGLADVGEFRWRAWAERLAGRPWLHLNLWFLFCAAAWVTVEMILARLFGGFPWNLLGVSQHRMLPLIQLASFTGVYGVSFLVVWFSVSLLVAVLLLARDPDRPMVWRRPLVFPALMVVATAASGFFTILQAPVPPRRLNVALIQPSIPQRVIFDPDSSTNRFQTLLELTEQALAAKPDLVVWPEASLPGGLSKADFDRLAAVVRGAGVWLVLGADETEEVPAEDPRREPETRSYNSAFLLDPAGRIVTGYRKRRLVMFGEYIPFVRWFPFLRQLAPIGDGFRAGERPVPFEFGNLGARAGILICFEDNFPQQAREHAPEDIAFLINLTNDAWFDRSAAQWQHAANAAFRAIENGVPLVRACNNGISCWIDPQGRFHSLRLAQGRDVYEAGFEVLQLTFGARRPTLYNRFGDVFGWACVLGTLAGVGVAYRPLTSRIRTMATSRG